MVRRRNKRQRVPGWLVLAVVLMTAGATAWAMSLTATGQGWTAPSSQPFPPRDAVRAVVPLADPAPDPGVLVAGVASPPTIIAGAVPPHGDRGTCTVCHAVVTTPGVPVPVISALATMAHQYRGVCTNCHHLTTGQPSAPGNAAAATPPAAPQLGPRSLPPGQSPATPPGRPGPTGPSQL